jgi:cardiolipin synthase
MMRVKIVGIGGHGTGFGTVRTVTDAADAKLSSHRILTAPNAFTLLRLCCLPVFLYLLFGRDNRAGAAWLLGGLGATDWVDGWLARRFDQVSEFGKVFDPTADRLLFIVTAIAIIIDRAAPLWFIVLVIVREFVLGAVLAVATLFFHMKRFDVSWWGKTATFLLMFAVPGFMLGASDFPGNTGFQIASWILGIPGLVISYWVAFTYVPTIRSSLREGRTTNQAQPA